MADTTSTATYTVTGMTCQHCVASVTGEISEIDGVQAVDVDLDSTRVTITGDQPVSDEAVRAALTQAGYQFAS